MHYLFGSLDIKNNKKHNECLQIVNIIISKSNKGNLFSFQKIFFCVGCFTHKRQILDINWIYKPIFNYIALLNRITTFVHNGLIRLRTAMPKSSRKNRSIGWIKIKSLSNFVNNKSMCSNNRYVHFYDVHLGLIIFYPNFIMSTSTATFSYNQYNKNLI